MNAMGEVIREDQQNFSVIPNNTYHGQDEAAIEQSADHKCNRKLNKNGQSTNL